MTGNEQTPIACSLDTGSLVERVGEWRAFVSASVVEVDAGPRMVRLVLDDSPAALVVAASLGQREKECCAFFDVAIEIGTDRRALCLRVPAGAEEAMAAFAALLTE